MAGMSQQEFSLVSKAEPTMYVQAACFWVKHHPDKFRSLMHLCHREVDAGNPSVQRGDVFNMARKAGMTVSEANELKRDNNLWPALSRYMVMLRPRLAKCLNFRKAGCDEVDMVAEWHGIVNAGTTFLANDWKEAKRLVEIKDVAAR